jgi:hypothetical protein
MLQIYGDLDADMVRSYIAKKPKMVEPAEPVAIKEED